MARTPIPRRSPALVGAALVLCLAWSAAIPAAAAGPPRFSGKASVRGEFLERFREVTVVVRGAERVRVKARSWEIGTDQFGDRAYLETGRSRWFALKRARGITWRLRRRNRQLEDALTGDILRVDLKACNRSGCTRLRLWFRDCFVTAGEPCRRARGPLGPDA